MNTPTRRLSPPDAITALVEGARQEASHIRERTRENQKQIARLGSELLELIGADPDTLDVTECSNHASRIKRKHQELAQALIGLTSPHLLAAHGLTAASTPFWEEPFQRAYNERKVEQQEEEERQARAEAYAEEEAFEANLKARLRAGEVVDVGYEQQMFNLRRQQSGGYAPTTVALG